MLTETEVIGMISVNVTAMSAYNRSAKKLIDNHEFICELGRLLYKQIVTKPEVKGIEKLKRIEALIYRLEDVRDMDGKTELLELIQENRDKINEIIKGMG